MAERLKCEFSLVRYVPDVVKGEFANIGVVLREAGANHATVRFTRDWSRVQCMHADVDLGMLQHLEVEMNDRLSRPEVLHGSAKPLMAALEDTLSNCVQVTEMRATLAESLSAEMDLLMGMYVNSLRDPPERKLLAGRPAIGMAMRRAFDSAGVWALLRKGIQASQYTQPGDPLRLDCGYRNGKVKMFHAVSLENSVEGAKGLAYSAGALREGVARVEGVELELTAVVDPFTSARDGEQYRFGVDVMEREAIRVLTMKDLGGVAATARRELLEFDSERSPVRF